MNFTLIKSLSDVSKKFSIENGELKKESGGHLSKGEFESVECELNEFKNILENVDHRHILVQGDTNIFNGFIVTPYNRAQYEEVDEYKGRLVYRDKKHFKYHPRKSGFLLLDYDYSSDYIKKDGKVEPLSKAELFDILFSVVPELADVPFLWKSSSSSNIYNEETGEQVSGLKGQHLFFSILNSSHAENFSDIIFKRLILAGHGYAFVDKTGKIHIRTLIDKVVNSPEREIFIKSNCVHPLKNRMECEVYNSENSLLSYLEPLTDEEERNYGKVVLSIKKKANKRANEVRGDYVSKNAKSRGVSEGSLKKSLNDRKIFGDFVIKLSNGTTTTVKDIFDNKKKYIDGDKSHYCYDPFEWEYNGGCPTQAWIDVSTNRIYSHAHGGINYEMIHDDRMTPSELADKVSKFDANLRFQKAAEFAIEFNYLSTEIEEFCNVLHGITGITISNIKSDFKSFYNSMGGNSTGKQKSNVKSSSLLFGDLSIPIKNPDFPITEERANGCFPTDSAENLQYILEHYGVTYHYDVILKKGFFNFPDGTTDDFFDAVAGSVHENKIKNLCNINGLKGMAVADHLDILFSYYNKNPILDFIKSKSVEKPSDGKSNIDKLIDSIVLETSTVKLLKDSNFDAYEYKKKCMLTWLVECVAALDGVKNTPLLKNDIGKRINTKFEYMLIFHGSQGKGKTSFFLSLLPQDKFPFLYIKDGIHLDLKEKDSKLLALGSWIAELGEIDSTFKQSEISKIKAFTSNITDEIRTPYGRTAMVMKRSTVFCGSVNKFDFIVDKTGNRRYLLLNVSSIKDLDQLGIDHQQFWREVYDLYIEGYAWWPDSELSTMIDIVTENHRTESEVEEAMKAMFDLDKNQSYRDMHGIRGDNSDGKSNSVCKNIRFRPIGVNDILRKLGIKTSTQNKSDVRMLLEKNGIYQPKNAIKYNGGRVRGYWLVFNDEKDAIEFKFG